MKLRFLDILFIILMSLISACLLFVGWQNYQTIEIVVEWSSASELNTVGYNLYRSLEEGQIGEKITPVLIPVGGDLLSGNEYSYTDQQVEAGKRYFYWLEDIDRQGIASKNGPIEIEAKRNMGGLLSVVLGVAVFILLIWVVVWRWRIGNRQSGR